MNYWIIVDDHHDGPYSARQLVDNGLQPDTLVWTEGLTDWTPAADIAELAAMIEHRVQQQAASVPPTCEAESHSEPVVQSIVVENITVEPAPEPEPAPAMQAAQQSEQLHQAPQQVAAAPIEPCPPSYIAWSIIVTLLCCTVVGIPAIVFASLTKSAYYRGNIEKAKRYSELTQWFIIASIVLGAMSWPFQMAFMGML